MRTNEFHAADNPAMDFYCSGIMGQQRQVITEHIEENGAHEPSQHFLDHCLFTYKVCALHHSRLFPVPIPRN